LRAQLERILLETDAPVSYQGRESRPKDVRISMEAVARLKGLDSLVISDRTTLNASRFFQISFNLQNSTDNEKP
jgi:TatD DNase family protein